MNTVISDARSKSRRCIRCRQVFCRIDLDGEQEIMRVGVGRRIQTGKPWKKSTWRPFDDSSQNRNSSANGPDPAGRCWWAEQGPNQ
jgi:hypothetical protein